MAVEIRSVPDPELQLYECFDCGNRIWTNAPIETCLSCGETDNFYLMD
jgi:hypothetical protein